MNCRKNWFYNFCIAFSAIGFLYIIVCGFMSLGKGQEYSYFPKGLLILGLFIVWMTAQFSAVVSAKFHLSEVFAARKVWVRITEGIIVIIVLAAALYVRLYMINWISVPPKADYKTYFEIAQLLHEGTLQKAGKGYCDYIAMFPHVLGYSFILSKLFDVVGVNVQAGLYLNVFFSMATILITYRIGRKLGGRITGLVALVGCAFWPSQVMYINILSAEYSFTFFLFLCVWLFISLVMDYGADTKHSVRGFTLHLLLGALIAIAAAIRPMALILLIAVILVLIPQKTKMPVGKSINDIPLTVRALGKGWIRIILILIPYLIISTVVTTNEELAVNRTLPSSSTSFGYNLLVGLNTESEGGWNQEDKDLLYNTMEETGSATQAHITCRDLAFTRLIINPKGIFNLFILKYELLWGNDDYGATTNIMFLAEDDRLPEELEMLLYTIRDWNDVVYVIFIFLGLIALIYMWKKDGNWSVLLVLLYLGTVAMHLMVETQNRYHYFVIQAFIILAGMGLQFIFNDAKEQMKLREKQKEEQTVIEQIEEMETKQIQMLDEKKAELQKEVMANVFDMKQALENGHVKMTVSQAYRSEENQDTDSAQTEE